MIDSRMNPLLPVAAACALTFATLAAPARADATRILGDWTASCWTGQARCAAETDAHAYTGRRPYRLTLSLARSDGAETGWEIGLRLRGETPAPNADLVLTTEDGASFRFAAGSYALTGSSRFVEFTDGNEVARLFPALRSQRRLTVAFTAAGGGKTTAAVSLLGLASALSWVDTQQGRVGSSDRIAAVKTAAPPEKPVEAPPEGAETASKPDETAAIRGETAPEPAESTEPAETASIPDEMPSMPAETTPGPAEAPVKPAEAPPEPVEDAANPVEAPVEEPAKPAEIAARAEEAPAEPVQTPAKPAEEPAMPTEAPAQPTDQGPAEVAKLTPQTPPATPTGSPALPEPVLAKHFAKSECEPLDGVLADRRWTTVAPLSENKNLYIIPCFAGAYNIAYRLYVMRNDDVKTMRTLYFANYSKSLGWYGSDTLINVSYDPETGILTALGKGRGSGDCGNAARYRWNDFDFKMIEYRAWYRCEESLPPEQWPVIYRAEK